MIRLETSDFGFVIINPQHISFFHFATFKMGDKTIEGTTIRFLNGAHMNANINPNELERQIEAWQRTQGM